MIVTIVAIVLLLTLFSTRIFAAEFYIVHDLTTQQCTVADKPPVTNVRSINLASDTIYKTRREAEAAMKAIKLCSPRK